MRATLVNTLSRPEPTDRVSRAYLHSIHGHGGKVVRVLLIPAEAEQWVMLWVFVNDGAVLQMAEVKHPHRAICTHRGKHVPATSGSAECNIIDLLVRSVTFTSVIFPHNGNLSLPVHWNPTHDTK